jgi:hypothetical protein
MLQLKDNLIEQLNIELEYYKNKLQQKAQYDNSVGNNQAYQEINNN